MMEQLDIFSNESYPKGDVVPTNNCVNIEKNWYKLTHNGMAILDQFYRSLHGMSGKRASPFLINMNHRCFQGYYEFYQMEYDQIYKHYTDSLYTDKLSDSDMFRKYGNELRGLTVGL